MLPPPLRCGNSDDQSIRHSSPRRHDSSSSPQADDVEGVALGGAASALLMPIEPCALNLWHNPRHYGEQLNHCCGISRIPQMPNESVSSCEG
jgi:hypothetical protein